MESWWTSEPCSTQVTISMSRWGCVSNPVPGSTMSSLLTSSRPWWVLSGSQWRLKLNECLESSQPMFVLNRSSARRMSIWGCSAVLMIVFATIPGRVAFPVGPTAAVVRRCGRAPTLRPRTASDRRFPVLAGLDHLLLGAGHEVPPHDDGLLERSAAERAAPVRRRPVGSSPSSARARGRSRRTRRGRRSPRPPPPARRPRGGRVRRPDRGARRPGPPITRSAPTSGESPRAGERTPASSPTSTVATTRRPRPRAASSGARRRPAPIAGGLRLGHPELEAVERAGGAGRCLLGVGHAPAGRHQVELAGLDELLAAEAVAVEHLPSSTQVTVCSPMCGCGPTRIAASRHVGRPEVVDEAPGPDRAAAPAGQRPRNRDPADVVQPPLADLDRPAHPTVVAVHVEELVGDQLDPGAVGVGQVDRGPARFVVRHRRRRRACP